MLNRVFISGYFGFGNLGDEAILEAVVRELRARFPRVHIVVPAGPERSHIERLGLEALDFFSLEEISTQIPLCDVVLFGLGGVFQDYWGADSSMLFQQGTNGVEAYVRPALLAAMHNVPAVLFSAGIGPLRTVAGRAMFAAAARAAKLLVVRDEASAVATSSITPELTPLVTADPAFLLSTSDSDREATTVLLRARGLDRAPFVAFALRGWEFQYSDDEIATSVGEAIKGLPEDWRIVFVPFHQGAGTDDAVIAQKTIAAGGRQADLIDVSTPAEAIALFEQAKLVVAARNHAVVFAALAGTPVVSLAYDPKVAASATHAGAGKWVLPFSDIRRLPTVLGEAVASAATVDSSALARTQASARAAFDLLEKDIRRRGAERSSGEPASVAADREMHGLRLQVAEKQKHNSALRDEIARRDALIESMQKETFAQITARDESVRAYQREAANLQVSLAIREKELAELQLRMTREQHELQQRAAREQHELQQRSARDLQELQERSARGLQDLQQRADIEQQRLRERIDELMREVQSGVDENAALRAHADEIRANYEEVQQKLLNTSLALEEAMRQYGAAMRTVDQRTGERDRLDRQLASVVGSKLWKVASTYWRVRERISGKPLTPGTTLAELPAVAASVQPLADVVSISGRDEAPVSVEGRYDVICFPIIDWDFRFQRPQQLMSQFAAQGHRVFYIAQKFRQSGPAYELRRIRDNVYEVSLRGPDRNVYTHRLTAAEADTFFDSIDTMRRELGLGATASVVQLPFWTPIAERGRDRFAWPLIYDCMDHHAGFSTNTDAMLNEETRLLNTSDLVVVSSLFLQEEARKHNENVILVRNACDFDHFSQVGDIPHTRPVIGYYGAIADWFDADLVADLAKKRSDWDFLLVGSTFTADLSRLSKLPNVTLAGEKPYAEIASWMERMDVCLIPFKRIPLTEATNPVKAYEMLAGGKPVVSVPIPEVVPLAPLVRLASTVDEFEREITASLEENNDIIREKRRGFAREHTWRTRYDSLAPAVAQSFAKVSVIIVTYNNVDLNRQCLESLFGRNEWPNVEVFAVDNASKDATPAYLLEAEKQYPNLRVILNDDNRGFAAANNQALNLATGDVLILLNNDTVSPRGWIAALLRHLWSDRTIGLIGPSTNAIGNEGMIDVTYKDVADMPRFAAEYMRANDRKTFDIPMLAMFCVAMRREVYEQIGNLDENFGMGMYEDDDYAHRMKLAGYRVVCARDAFVHHWMKAAFGKIPTAEYQKLFEKNRAYYEEKWGMKWQPHQRA